VLLLLSEAKRKQRGCRRHALNALASVVSIFVDVLPGFNVLDAAWEPLAATANGFDQEKGEEEEKEKKDVRLLLIRCATTRPSPPRPSIAERGDHLMLLIHALAAGAQRPPQRRLLHGDASNHG